MIRKLPLVPTLVVALAAATMIGLGFWQIGRAEEKEALLARLSAAKSLAPVAYPSGDFAGPELPLFRRATADCVEPGSRRTIPGKSVNGEVGYVHVVQCRPPAGGPPFSVAVGWSKNPNAALDWAGGPVAGLVAPDSRTRIRIVAEQPAPGLQGAAPPSIESIPNNHRGYVVTWFSFAALAILIYALALRERLTAQRNDSRNPA